jgi:hypothetical protein
MAHTKLDTSVAGDARTIYSLRHTAIMYRLIFGVGINTLMLARNARTSVEMIDRFYAKPLTGEMNVAMLQSRRPREIYDGEAGQDDKTKKPDESKTAEVGLTPTEQVNEFRNH